MNEPAPQRPRAVVVRHGETLWAVRGRHTGRTDVPLTDRGLREAEELGARLAGFTFALVLVSPMERALETCRRAGYGTVAESCPDLREWDYGDYEGRTTPDILAGRPEWSLWDDGVPGGETVQDVGARADRVIARVRAAPGDVALFAHGHLLRILTARWLGFPPAEGRRFALGPAGIGLLGYEHKDSVVVRWNEAPGGGR